MSKPIPKLGQRLFAVGCRRHSAGEWWMVVTNVGRKYFKAKREDDANGYSETRFHLDTWYEANGYSANVLVYESEEQYREEQEATALLAKLRKYFDHFGTPKLSLQQLKAIIAIIEPTQP